MATTIVFIHGMFQNPKSWFQWVNFFEARGFDCINPAWPLHEGEPSDLRANIPAGTGDLTLADVNARMEEIISTLDEPPILIGHSIGGLIAQVLVNKGKATAGVCICPVAPNAMLSFEWNFLKSTVPILNPAMGDAAQEMTSELFHEAFANTLNPQESLAAWKEYAVHESRNVLRGALGEAGSVDLKKSHTPLLLISASEDHIVPPSLVKKNFEAYEEAAGIKTLYEFPDRGHFICVEPGWEEVATYVDGWLAKSGAASTPAGTAL